MRRTAFGIKICWVIYIIGGILFLLDLFGMPLIDSLGSGKVIILFVIAGLYLFGIED